VNGYGNLRLREFPYPFLQVSTWAAVAHPATLDNTGWLGTGVSQPPWNHITDGFLF
jgi:hypothetical protein